MSSQCLYSLSSGITFSVCPTDIIYIPTYLSEFIFFEENLLHDITIINELFSYMAGIDEDNGIATKVDDDH